MKRLQTVAGVAAAIASSPASAASEWVLTSIASYDNPNFSYSMFDLSGVLTFSDGPGNSLQADGTFSMSSKVGMTPLFTWTIGSDFVISGDGSSTGSFSCSEGIFGGIAGIHICGNYDFGANGYNESIVNSDGSGLIIGGDDVDRGPAPSLAEFQGFVPDIPPTDFQNTIVLDNGGGYSGYIWTFTANTAVPIPPALWLFGSALGLLAWTRRRS